MQPVLPDADVGVLVGRFQVHDLHDGHRALIDSVRQRHKKVLILLGSTPGLMVTRNNPLDYPTRALMLQQAYPDVLTAPLKDMPDDRDWSLELDQRVREVFANESVLLYGSRDAFVPFYRGAFPVVELQATQRLSGTQVRQAISHEVRASQEFRRGVVYAAYNRHLVSFQAVDAAIVRGGGAEVLLARKRHDLEGCWRFVGGFVDPQHDQSLEDAVRREVAEEAGGVGIGAVRYLGSARIADWRYRREQDSILSAFFLVPFVHGQPHAADDVHQVQWFARDQFADRLIPEHRVLGRLLLTHLEKESNDEPRRRQPDPADR